MNRGKALSGKAHCDAAEAERHARATWTNPTVQSRTPEFDGFRGIACLMVIVGHYVCGQLQTGSGTFPKYVAAALELSWTGVDVFFVLSGFLVGGILLDGRGRPHATTAFLLRRACRLLPLLYLSIAAMYLFRAFTRGDASSDALVKLTEGPIPWWSYVLSIQNIIMVAARSDGPNWLGITWSLAIEIQFYLLIAALVHVLPPARLFTAVAALVAGALALRLGLTITMTDAIFRSYCNETLLPTRMDTPLIGVLVAIAVRRPSWRNALERQSTRILQAGVACAAIVAVMNALGHRAGTAWMDTVGLSLIAVGAACALTFLAVRDSSLLHRLCRLKALTAVGTVSYGVYLLHEPIAGLMHHYLRDQLPRITGGIDALVTLLAFATTLALAAASWRWFESPIIRASHGLRAGVPSLLGPAGQNVSTRHTADIAAHTAADGGVR